MAKKKQINKETFKKFAQSKMKIAKEEPSLQNIQSLFNASVMAIEDLGFVQMGMTMTEWAKACLFSLARMDFDKFYGLAVMLNNNHETTDETDMFWAILRYESQYKLDSYCLYVEKNRPLKEQFYYPRRKTMKKVADKIQMLEDDKLDELFLHCPARVGKLVASNCPVFTSEGWKNHGDLKVGDKVIGSDGAYTEVTQVHPKYHTEYKVTLSNHDVIEVHGNHEWTVYDRRIHNFRTLETKEMIDHLRAKDGHYTFSLYPRSTMNGTYREDLAVEPYVLGAWLGDGTNTQPLLTFAQSDIAIVHKFERLGYPLESFNVHKTTGVPSFRFGTKLSHGLRKYDMCFYNKTCEKHIPIEYLTASLQQRLQLLAGLLDTDGCLIRKENRYHFSTTSERLKDDFVDLINTFGWRVSVTRHEPCLSSSGIQGRLPVYDIGFNPTMHIPCVLARKQIYEFSDQHRISIRSIEPCEPQEGNCISVANEDGLYCVGKSMSLTHNSQMMTMATAWHCAKNTEWSNLYCSYKEDAGGAFLDGVIEIWTDKTYCHADVFPEAKIVSTDAKAHTVDLQRKKKYKSLSGKGLTSGLNGLYDATGWLIADDILEGIQDVLNPEILKRKQTVFDNNLMKRRKEKCKVIYIGTIWSLHDIYMNRLGFLQNNPMAKNIRYEVLKIPALDENDESNFDYKFGVGFSTQYYRTERAKFEENDDMASWFSQCQQEPIERDGAVFNPEHMRFYNGVLPAEKPYRICGACDVALGGQDYLAFAIAYMYENGDIYIDDVVFDNSEKNITKPQVVDKILEHEIGSVFFEANQGGEGYKDEVDQMLRQMGKKINFTSEYAPTNKRKEQRIWDKAPSIREWYFRDTGCRSPQYRKFMNNLYSFTINGKNNHDDAPDCLSTLAYFIEGNWNCKTQVIKNFL